MPKWDASDVLQALKQDMDLGDTPEEQEEALLMLAEVIVSDPEGVYRKVEEYVRAMRLDRGACPECGERLEPVERRGVEYHPYGMGVALEERVEVEELECPMCGLRFDREEVGEPVW